jgi:hypothetical protein
MDNFEVATALPGGDISNSAWILTINYSLQPWQQEAKNSFRTSLSNNPAATHLVSNRRSRAAAAEKIHDELVLISSNVDDSLQ